MYRDIDNIPKKVKCDAMNKDEALQILNDKKAERHHNDNFKAHLDRFLPEWRSSRDILNQSILSFEEW